MAWQKVFTFVNLDQNGYRNTLKSQILHTKTNTRKNKTMKVKTPLIALTLVTLLFISLPQLSMASAPRLENLNDTMCHDAKTGLMWQFGKSKALTSPKEAVEYAENLVLDGYSDWRLPTSEEHRKLKNIFDLKQYGDCDLVRLDSSFWTVDVKKGTQPGKLEPNDQCGGGYDFIVKKKGYVRAVRP